MKNKGLILLVCLVLAAFGFTTAAAEGSETVTTITCKPGLQLAQEAALNQICETAAIRIHAMPEGYGAFVVSLNDVDALSSLFRFEENGVYVQSQMFGKTPLYFSWEDLKNLLLEQLKNNPELQSANSMFSGDMLVSLLEGTMTEEQALEMLGIDEEMIAFLSDVGASQTVETGAFTLEGSDVANQKAVTVLTKEDLIRAVNLPIVRKQIANQLSMSAPSLSEEEINREVDAQLAEIKQAIEENNLSVTTAVYMKDDEFIAFELLVGGTMNNYSGGTDSAGISLTLTKTTIETAEFYQMALKFFQGDEEIQNQYGSLYLDDGFIAGRYMVNSFEGDPVLAADFCCDSTLDGQTTAELSATLYDGSPSGQGSVLVVFDQQKAENTTDTAIDVYTGSVGLDELKADLAKSSLISFNFHTVAQPDSGFFTDLQNATPETSVQLMQMSEEDLNGYMQAMQQSFMMTIFAVIDNLPPDISNSLMQEMGPVYSQ